MCNINITDESIKVSSLASTAPRILVFFLVDLDGDSWSI